MERIPPPSSIPVPTKGSSRKDPKVKGSMTVGEAMNMVSRSGNTPSPTPLGAKTACVLSASYTTQTSTSVSLIPASCSRYLEEPTDKTSSGAHFTTKTQLKVNTAAVSPKPYRKTDTVPETSLEQAEEAAESLSSLLPQLSFEQTAGIVAKVLLAHSKSADADQD